MNRLLLIVFCVATWTACERQKHLPSLPEAPDAATEEADVEVELGPTTFVIENGINQPVYIHGSKGLVDVYRNTYSVRRTRVNPLCDWIKACDPPPAEDTASKLDVGGKAVWVWQNEVWKPKAVDERTTCEFAEPIEPGDWTVKFCWAGQLLEGIEESLLDTEVCKTLKFEPGSRVEVVVDEAPPAPTLPEDPQVELVQKRVFDCAARHPLKKRKTVELEVAFDQVGGFVAKVTKDQLRETEFATCIGEPFKLSDYRKTIPDTVIREFSTKPAPTPGPDAGSAE